MTKEKQIKKLVDELMPLLDLGEKNMFIGLLEGMIISKANQKDNCENAQ